MKNVAAGANPMGVKRGIEAAVDTAVASLKALSVPVTNKQDIARWPPFPPAMRRSAS